MRIKRDIPRASALSGNAFFNGTASIPGAAHMPSRSQMWGYGPVNHPRQSAIDRITQTVSVTPLEIDYAKHRAQYDEEPFDLHKDHGLKIGQALYIRGDGMLMEPPAQRQSHGLGLRHGR